MKLYAVNVPHHEDAYIDTEHVERVELWQARRRIAVIPGTTWAEAKALQVGGAEGSTVKVFARTPPKPGTPYKAYLVAVAERSV